jgi:hypothetical protein
MARTEHTNWSEWLIILGLILSVALTGVFVVRSVRVAAQFRQDEPIRPWMTIPYVAHSYHVPAAVLYQALGLPLPARPYDRRPLEVVARLQHRPVQDVIADLYRVIKITRTSPPPSTPDQRGSAP